MPFVDPAGESSGGRGVAGQSGLDQDPRGEAVSGGQLAVEGRRCAGTPLVAEEVADWRESSFVLFLRFTTF